MSVDADIHVTVLMLSGDAVLDSVVPGSTTVSELRSMLVLPDSESLSSLRHAETKSMILLSDASQEVLDEDGGASLASLHKESEEDTMVIYLLWPQHPREDGFYVAKDVSSDVLEDLASPVRGSESIKCSVLRFYSDGQRVMATTVSGERVQKEKVASLRAWFYWQGEHDARGTYYKLKAQNAIEFSTVSLTCGTVKCHGVLGLNAEVIKLHKYSLKNGRESDATYEFLPFENM